MQAGDRWAAVRSDEQGQEVRVGERRAAMHSDESGSEMRVEDRWAAVRREEPRPEYRRGGGARHEEPWEGRAVGAIEPAQSWGHQAAWPEQQPEPEPVGRRRYRDEGEERYAYPASEEGLRSRRSRRAEYEPSDDRWR
jgi:hypothetical protein